MNCQSLLQILFFAMILTMASFIVEFMNLLLQSDAFYCYNCASNLPFNISKEAQRAFKMVLYSTYMVPPINTLCANSKDIFFKTVPQRDCSSNDQCVKITVQQKGLQFVMRGCENLIYRGKVIVNDAECHDGHSPSVCRCSGNLCNAACGNYFLYYKFCLIILLTIFQILGSFWCHNNAAFY